MNKTTKTLACATVFVGMFMVGMQLDFSKQVMAVYHSLGEGSNQKALIKDR